MFASKYIQSPLIVLVSLWITSQAWALSCVQDLNGNEAIDAATEAATCQTTPQGELCPIGAVACTQPETCSLDPQLPCAGGSCVKTGTCTPTGVGTDHVCDLDSTTYPTAAQCTASCSQAAACTLGSMTCPTDATLACMDTGGGNYQCSPNQCADMSSSGAASNPDVTTTTIDTSMPDNSGPRDANGNCLGSISIFGGRGMNCKKAGLRSGFHDCCDNGGSGLIADSVGADVGTQIAQQGLSAMGHFAYTAYTAYGALSGGSLTAAQAATTATQYAYNSVLLNPATWYLGAASIIVSQLIAEKCSQMDMETAMAVGSGFCHYVGKYCAEKWKIIGCVQKKASYCCFNSMLGRIIQEQGRPQLQSFTSSPTGIWGTAEQPLCRGMSPEEFQTLDFSSMNLSEYFGYITQVANDTISAGVPQASMNNAVTNFYNGIR